MIVCTLCARIYVAKKNGVAFEEGRHEEQPGGVVTLEPYKLWVGDAWACPSCGHEVIFTSPSQRPIAEHYEESYAENVARFEPVCRVR